MDSDPYIESWRQACAANAGLGAWTPIFAKLPGKVASMYPKDVVCITGAQVVHDNNSDSFVLVAHVLALDGYDLYAALDHRKRFREQHPGFEPGAAMLCSTDALIEQYGVIWGRMLADLLLHPEAQPVMYQMFFGRIDDDPTDVGIRVAQRRCYQMMYAARAGVRSDGKPDLANMTEWQERDCRELDLYTAQYTFGAHTGGQTLRPTVYVPIDPEKHLCHVATPSP